MTRVDQIIAVEEEYQRLGVVYRAVNPGRCNPRQSGFCDCSGCQCAAYNEVMGPAGFSTPLPCMTSGQMWTWCVAAGTEITVAAARTARGAWVFVDSPGVPGGEHVGISDGNGRVFAAHSPTEGLSYKPFDANRWDRAAMPPHVLDVSPTPTATPTGGLPVPLDADTQTEIKLLVIAALKDPTVLTAVAQAVVGEIDRAIVTGNNELHVVAQKILQG